MIPRIAGVILPSNKKILYSLPYIYGIGLPRAKLILEKAKVNPDKRTKDLNEEELEKIRKEVEQFKVEGDLKMEISQNVKRLIEINCYRGIRHKRQLPVHGQKTRKNCRTVRHNVRKTMSSGKKPPAQKT